MTVFSLELGDVLTLKGRSKRYLVTRVEDILMADDIAACCGCEMESAKSIHRRVTISVIDGSQVQYGAMLIVSDRDDHLLLERMPGICSSPKTPCASQGG